MADRTFFRATRAALATYDLTASDRYNKWREADTEAEIYRLEDEEQKALEQVQIAFHADTNDINSLDHCKLVGIDFMRRIAKLGEDTEKQTH